MPSEFNPYGEWLGLDIRGQSPNYYQLLGVPDFEANPEAIWAAAYQRRAILRAEQYGDHSEIAKRVLAEVDAAEACLLNPGRKTDYDKALRSGEVPPLIQEPATASQSPARGSGSRRSERRFKPAEKEPGQPPLAAAEPPPAREPATNPPVADVPVPDPIAEAGRSNGPKAAWGYDDGVPFRPDVSRPAAGPQPPLAAAPAMRPADFLPPPASPTSFGAPTSPPMASPPMGTIPMGTAPMGAVPMGTVPGAFAPPGWTPGAPASPPAAAIPPTAAVPGYPAAPYPPYASPPAAQPGWASVPGAPTAGVPLAGQAAPGGYPGPTGYSPAPLASAPMAAPYAPAAAPMAAPMAPMAAPLAAATARAIETDDFGPMPGAAPAAAGPVVSGSPRRFVRRPSPAFYALGGFLAAVAVGVAAIVAMNRRPPRDDHAVVQNAPEKTHESKSAEISRPAKKSPLVVPPEKTNDPPAKTESIPNKTPTKTEPGKTEPANKEPTKEKPKTEPKAKPKADPQRDEFVAAALMSARYYLAERDLKKAKEMIALAKKHGVGAAHEEETERVRLLAHYVDEFWKAVKAHCKGLDGGAALTIQGITIAFVEGNDEYVTFRRAGRNERHYFFPSPAGPSMKTGLAVGLAELYLAKNDAVSSLILGSFKTVNATSDRAEARGHFDTAQSQGDNEIKQTVRLLRPELDVSVPKEAPTLPPAPGMPMPAVPSDGSKPKPPSGDVLVKAQETMRAKFKQQLAGAVFESDKAALASKLQAAAGSEGLDDATRYALLLEARDLAAGGRNLKLALEIVATIDERFTIDLLAMKIDVLAAAQKAAADDAAANKEVAQSALSLADEAALAEKFAQASRLAAMAVQTARKAKDPELAKQATAREKEIKALKP